MIGASPPRHLCACARVHYAWVVAVVIFVALLLAGAVRSAPGILTVAYEDEFGWSRAEIAGAVSTNILLYGLLGPFAAALMEASGVRATLLAALAMLAAGAGVTVLMDRLWHLYVLWGVVVGCAAGVIAPTLGKIVANRWFVARAGLVMGLFSASSSTGQVALAPAIGAALEARGWRAATLVVAGVAAALMPLVALLLVDRPADIGVSAYGLVPAEEPAEGAAQGGKGGAAEDAAGDDVVDSAPGAAAAGAAASSSAPAASVAPVTPAASAASRDRWAAFTTPVAVLRAVARDRNFQLLAASFCVCGASTNGLISTTIVPACIDHGWGAEAASGFLSGIGVFDIVGTVASGWLSDRYDSRRLLCVYYGLRGVALLLLPSALRLSLAGMWPWAVLYGLDWIATVPPTARLCSDCFGKERSAVVFAWLLAAHQVGAAAAAAGAGAARTGFGSYSGAYFFSGALCVATALGVLLIAPPREVAGRGLATVAAAGIAADAGAKEGGLR
jgi:MFS family permease